MTEVVIVLIIAYWLYKTAFKRKQNKAIWVIGGLIGYFTGELIIGWRLARFLVEVNKDLQFLKAPTIVAAGLLGMLLVRFVLLTFWKEGEQKVA